MLGELLVLFSKLIVIVSVVLLITCPVCAIKWPKRKSDPIFTSHVL